MAFRSLWPLQASPEFKGIKTNENGSVMMYSPLQASPEFKGIKTRILSAMHRALGVLQASPEFKGIKTSLTVAVLALIVAPSQP